jgi:hypothetical protein
MVRIPVDFNTMNTNPDEKVVIYTKAHFKEDEEWIRELKAGCRVILYDGEMEVEAILEGEPGAQIWYGIPDWSTRKDL